MPHLAILFVRGYAIVADVNPILWVIGRLGTLLWSMPSRILPAIDTRRLMVLGRVNERVVITSLDAFGLCLGLYLLSH